MKTNLYTASRQWAERPADERFWTLTDLYRQTRQYAEESKIKTVELSKCLVAPTESGDLVLQGPNGNPASFQHYSFGQLANICKAPASYLRQLPASIAAANLNHGLAQHEGESSLLFHVNGGLQLRCVTSDIYERIWNFEVAELALALEEQHGWMTPPARPSNQEGVPTRIATDADVLKYSSHTGLGVKAGDTISPAGLYASDHDCFIFQVNENRAIDGGNGETLYRGVFWSNSEVGSARFKATMFLYETICGNHIVWGAKKVAEVSIVHKGNARRMFAQAMATITDRMDKSATEDQARIVSAKQKLLGESKEEVVTFVYGKSLGLSRSECENAYVLADRYSDVHGDPNTAWGFSSGVTRLSQQKYADQRDRMDRAAGKVLETAF